MQRLADIYDKLNRGHKILLLLIGGAFALYLSFADKVAPASSQYENAVAERDALAVQLAGIAQVNQDKAAAELELKKAEEDLAGLFQQLPLEPDTEGLLGMVSELARTADVELVNYKVEAEPALDASISQIPVPGTQATRTLPDQKTPRGDEVQQYVNKKQIKLDIAGTFPKVNLFLDAVLSLPRIVRVGELELVAPDFDKVVAGQPPRLLVSLQLTTYFQKNDLETVAKPLPEARPQPLSQVERKQL